MKTTFKIINLIAKSKILSNSTKIYIIIKLRKVAKALK